MIDDAVTDWVVQAFREDDETLDWELALPGVGKDALARALNLTLVSPDCYPVTVQQVIAAVGVSASAVSPDDLDLDPVRLSFFLAAVAKNG